MGILTTDMQQLVREQRLAFVASVNADGTPSLSPKATATVFDDDHLAYLDVASPGTRANVAANPVLEINNNTKPIQNAQRVCIQPVMSASFQRRLKARHHEAAAANQHHHTE